MQCSYVVICLRFLFNAKMYLFIPILDFIMFLTLKLSTLFALSEEFYCIKNLRPESEI